MKSNEREDSKCLNIMFIDDVAISYVGSLYLIFRKLKLEFNGNCVKSTTCLQLQFTSQMWLNVISR